MERGWREDSAALELVRRGVRSATAVDTADGAEMRRREGGKIGRMRLRGGLASEDRAMEHDRRAAAGTVRTRSDDRGVPQVAWAVPARIAGGEHRAGNDDRDGRIERPVEEIS